MNTALMNAILAMDSYNRGYSEGVLLSASTDSKIGNAVIVSQSDVSLTGAAYGAGFYAVAYDTNEDGQDDIISYRGTDDPTGSDSDITNGWVLGGGDENDTTSEIIISHRSTDGLIGGEGFGSDLWNGYDVGVNVGFCQSVFL